MEPQGKRKVVRGAYRDPADGSQPGGKSKDQTSPVKRQGSKNSAYSEVDSAYFFNVPLISHSIALFEKVVRRKGKRKKSTNSQRELDVAAVDSFELQSSGAVEVMLTRMQLGTVRLRCNLPYPFDQLSH